MNTPFSFCNSPTSIYSRSSYCSSVCFLLLIFYPVLHASSLIELSHLQISRITDDLRAATFVLDTSEEEVAKALIELLQPGSFSSDSLECREVKALQLAASRLDITSSKAILIEKRSIKRLMDKVVETDQSKK